MALIDETGFDEPNVLLEFIQNDPNLSGLLKSGLEKIARNLDSLNIDTKKMAQNVQESFQPNDKTKEKIQKTFEGMADKFGEKIKKLDKKIIDAVMPADGIKKQIENSFNRLAKKIEGFSKVDLDIKELNFDKIFLADVSKFQQSRKKYQDVLETFMFKFSKNIAGLKWDETDNRLNLSKLFLSSKDFDKIIKPKGQKFVKLLDSVVNNLTKNISTTDIKVDMGDVDFSTIFVDIKKRLRAPLQKTIQNKYNELIEYAFKRMKEVVSKIEDAKLKAKVMQFIDSKLGGGGIGSPVLGAGSDLPPQISVTVESFSEKAMEQLGKYTGKDKAVKIKQEAANIEPKKETLIEKIKGFMKNIAPFVMGALFLWLEKDKIIQWWKEHKVGETLEGLFKSMWNKASKYIGDSFKPMIQNGLKAMGEAIKDNPWKTAGIGIGLLALLKPGLTLSAFASAVRGIGPFLAGLGPVGWTLLAVAAAAVGLTALAKHMENQSKKDLAATEALKDTHKAVGRENIQERMAQFNKELDAAVKDGQFTEKQAKRLRAQKAYQVKKEILEERKGADLEALKQTGFTDAQANQKLYERHKAELGSAAGVAEENEFHKFINTDYKKAKGILENLQERDVLRLQQALETNKTIRKKYDKLTDGSSLRDAVNNRYNVVIKEKAVTAPVTTTINEKKDPMKDWVAWGKNGEINVRPIDTHDDITVTGAKEGGTIENVFKELKQTLGGLTMKLNDVKVDLVKELKQLQTAPAVIPSSRPANTSQTQIADEYEKTVPRPSLDTIVDHRLNYLVRMGHIA